MTLLPFSSYVITAYPSIQAIMYFHPSLSGLFMMVYAMIHVLPFFQNKLIMIVSMMKFKIERKFRDIILKRNYGICYW